MATFACYRAATKPSNKEKDASGIVLLGFIADYNRNRECDRLMVASSPIRSENALGMPDGHLIGAQSSLAADQATHQSWGDTSLLVLSTSIPYLAEVVI